MAIISDDAAPVGYFDIDKPPVTEGVETWMSVYALSVREMKELEFAKLYVEKFDHGTDGHGRLHLIEHMNSILESMFEANTQLLAENEGFREILASEGYNVPAVEETLQAEIDVLQSLVDSQTTTLETLQATMPQSE